MTKAHELRELTDDVLQDRVAEAKAELWKRRFDLATGQLDKQHELPYYRREIARLQTIIRAREIEAHEAQMQER